MALPLFRRRPLLIPILYTVCVIRHRYRYPVLSESQCIFRLDIRYPMPTNTWHLCYPVLTNAQYPALSDVRYPSAPRALHPVACTAASAKLPEPPIQAKHQSPDIQLPLPSCVQRPASYPQHPTFVLLDPAPYCVYCPAACGVRRAACGVLRSVGNSPVGRRTRMDQATERADWDGLWKNTVCEEIRTSKTDLVTTTGN